MSDLTQLLLVVMTPTTTAIGIGAWLLKVLIVANKLPDLKNVIAGIFLIAGALTLTMSVGMFGHCAWTNVIAVQEASTESASTTHLVPWILGGGAASLVQFFVAGLARYLGNGAK